MEKAQIRKDEAAVLRLNAELLKVAEMQSEIIDEESAKLDKFLELLRDASKTPKAAEKEAFDVDTNFYLKIRQAEERERRRVAYERRKAEREKKAREEARRKEIEESNRTMNRQRAKERRARRRLQRKKEKAAEALEKPLEKPQVKPSLFEGLDGKFYKENSLPAKKQEALFAKGYRRLKISPFGDSGAAFYWVRTRYNESKEHAFFCYLIEAELQKYTKKIEMNVNYGPDIVFEHKGKKYCFDVETGKNIHKHPEALESKFLRYKKEHEISFILVTDKSLKYTYAKYGTVVTRGKLRETLSKLFLNTP